jgi:hypothetical protein
MEVSVYVFLLLAFGMLNSAICVVDVDTVSFVRGTIYHGRYFPRYACSIV